MVEYLTSECEHRLTHEACDVCGKDLVMPEGGLKRPLHICEGMALDDPRVVAWLKSISKTAGATALIDAVTNENRPASLGFLPVPKTVGDLKQWSKWDFRKLKNVSHTRSDMIARAMAKAGVPLLDITYQKAASRRTQWINSIANGSMHTMPVTSVTINGQMVPADVALKFFLPDVTMKIRNG